MNYECDYFLQYIVLNFMLDEIFVLYSFMSGSTSLLLSYVNWFTTFLAVTLIRDLQKTEFSFPSSGCLLDKVATWKHNGTSLNNLVTFVMDHAACFSCVLYYFHAFGMYVKPFYTQTFSHNCCALLMMLRKHLFFIFG